MSLVDAYENYAEKKNHRKCYIPIEKFNNNVFHTCMHDR